MSTLIISPNQAATSGILRSSHHQHNNNNKKENTANTLDEDDDVITLSTVNMSGHFETLPGLKTLADMAPVSLTDFNVHQRLQEGAGFQVFKIQVNRNNPTDDDLLRQYFSLKCLKNKSQSREAMELEAKLLQKEARMMQRLRHPNIVNAVGLSSHSSFGYFLAYDLIEETLEDRIISWKTGSPIKTAASRRHKNASQQPNNKKRKGHAPPLDQRLHSCVLGIARAMMYLHSRHIVNPLRPDCIGFDRNGVIKVFDFSHYDNDPKVQHLRYMSPEYILSNCASFASDVYSLGIIIWQVATLKEPFSFVLKFKDGSRHGNNDSNRLAQIQERNKKIAKKLTSKRPEMRGIPDKDVRQLLKDCWDSNPDARPSATRVLFRLADCLPHEESHEQRLDRIEALLRSHEAKKMSGGSHDDDEESRGSGARFESAYDTRITR